MSVADRAGIAVAVGGVGSSARPTVTRVPLKRCGDCQGLGEIFGYRNVEDGPMDVTVWPCAECSGSGYVEAVA